MEENTEQIKTEFPFQWGSCWTWCARYTVKDLQKETDFYKNVLKFKVFTYDETFVMFTNPAGDMYISVTDAGKGEAAAPGTFALEFMIKDIFATAKVLEERGIVFKHKVSPYNGSADLYKGTITTPGGIDIDLWGMAGE